MSFEHAVRPGQNKVWSLYDLSACQALLGYLQAALQAMSEALTLKYPDRRQFAEDEDFASLRSDAEFRRLAGEPTKKGLSRDEQWRYDLDFAVQELKRLHFNLLSRHYPSAVRHRGPSFSCVDSLDERPGDCRRLF